MGGARALFCRRGKNIKAKGLVDAEVVAARARHAKKSIELADALRLRASHYLRIREWSEAESLLRESLEIANDKQPQHWTNFEAQSLLGAALAGQGKFGEAESLLLAGYEGLRERKKHLPAQYGSRLDEAIQRLIQLYAGWNKPEEEARWQKALEAAAASR
jgi:hypothetical protein